MSPFFSVPTPGRRVELVRAVNEAKTQWEHDTAESFLRGWDECYRSLAGKHPHFAQFCDCDEEFGDERPVCGGVWLDWKPGGAS